MPGEDIAIGQGGFEGLGPAAMRSVERPIGDIQEPLLGEEPLAIRDAVPRRRIEFASGRSCARLALQRLGLAAVPIPQAADRSPIWPSGVVGSITHSGGLCAAAVAWAGEVTALGIDTELCGAVEPALSKLILRDDEGLASGLDEDTERDLLTLFFSAKEAAYKACYPTLRRLMGFHEMRVTLQRGGRLLAEPLPMALRPMDRLHGRYRISAGRIRVCVWSLAIA